MLICGQRFMTVIFPTFFPFRQKPIVLVLEGHGRKEEYLKLVQERLILDPEHLAAFQQGLASGGYETAFRSDGDLLAARYDRSPDKSAEITIAFIYRTAGDVERLSIGLRRPARNETEIYLISEGQLTKYYKKVSDSRICVKC